MPNKQIVPITNGQGSVELVNGTYTITSETTGYNDVSINPSSQVVSDGVNRYDFTIAATGTLTLHVSDDGTESGVPIVGATFVRCDASGQTYGTEITSNQDGNAVFNNVPFDSNTAPLIYFKQTASDLNHTFNAELQNTSLTTSTLTVEITNPDAPLRTFSLTDANYANLPIADGQINLN